MKATTRTPQRRQANLPRCTCSDEGPGWHVPKALERSLPLAISRAERDGYKYALRDLLTKGSNVRQLFVDSHWLSKRSREELEQALDPRASRTGRGFIWYPIYVYCPIHPNGPSVEVPPPPRSRRKEGMDGP